MFKIIGEIHSQHQLQVPSGLLLFNIGHKTSVPFLQTFDGSSPNWFLEQVKSVKVRWVSLFLWNASERKCNMLLLYFREKRQIRVKKKFTPSTGFGGGKPKKKTNSKRKNTDRTCRPHSFQPCMLIENRKTQREIFHKTHAWSGQSTNWIVWCRWNMDWVWDYVWHIRYACVVCVCISKLRLTT